MERVRINLIKTEDTSYDILIGSDYIKNEVVGLGNYERAHFIVDKNISKLYHDYFINEIFTLNTSEHEKNLTNIEKILSFLKGRGCLRSDTLIAVGGGIVGDMAGFAASIYMRGISFIQVPTTLLSMVDSSVGGKTGVNLGDVKNLIGSFYQPKKVLIDTIFLDTLPDEEFFCGFAEVIKYALIFDNSLYYFLIENKDKILKKDKEIMEFVIKRCCEIKGTVVEEDETEKGIRRLLNLGHTFGHAIEVDSDHKIKHGQAVAKGIYLETLFGVRMGIIPAETLDIIKTIFDIYQYELMYIPKDIDRFMTSLSSDKKAKSNGIVLALTYSLGNGTIKEGIDLVDIKKFFEGAR
ncbi:MAG: 3-dehydroquinate synthase [Deferribacterales bacterium]